jgi:hypothetical protein
MLAAERGQLDVLRLLLDAPPFDPHTHYAVSITEHEDEDGRTALMLGVVHCVDLLAQVGYMVFIL